MTTLHTLIIGGGLSGLTLGIALAKTGRRVSIVSAAPSTLELNGGSMELLGCVDGQTVAQPIDAIARLPKEHPYSKIGPEQCALLALEAVRLLGDSGIHMDGSAECNHWRITPLGVTKPAWLSLRGMATATQPHCLPWSRATLVNLPGFMDYPIHLVAHNLSLLGCDIMVRDIEVEGLSRPRRLASEMRAANLARTIGTGSKLRRLAEAINQTCRDDEAVLLPAIIGLEDDYPSGLLRSWVSAPLHFLATMPPSVPGTSMAGQLRHYFKMLGGKFLSAETIGRAQLTDGHVTALYTAKSPTIPITAEHYVLASGSLMSQGLLATHEAIIEPLFGLDVDAPDGPDQWSRYGLLGDQPFMRCGVLTDARLHGLKDGKPIDNLHVIGSILAGHNPLTMGDGHGVDLLTALSVAHQLTQT
ncbi:MAG: glycerol-3-phosphate dehydrogenase subunit GlpB [Muribaculaceae bacterium]|nr:glycerol-3-phosphate dehydrogenase subunit GlpB [Muribaculaceae bacterium]